MTMLRSTQHKLTFVVCLALLPAIIGVAFAEETRDPAQLGLIVNLDGDDAFPAMELSESQRLLRADINRWADAGVGTLVYCVGAGSEIMLYPTKVADTWGWRKTPYDDDPKWAERIERNRRNTEAGGDGPRTAGEAAVARGMAFFPSLRMNDGHYAFGKPPEDYPLTGSFYLNHRDLVLGESPIRSKAEYGQLLDFSHEAVRAHRMAQAMEIVERYADIMAGFELDFTRFQVFFPPGTASERGHLLTEMVSRVRDRLTELGEANGRRYLLMVRVPPSPANCAWSGIEIGRWIDEGLIDVVVPSQMMTTAFCLPVDRFAALAEGKPVAVYATLLPRVGWRWVSDDSGAVLGAPSRDIDLAQLNAAAVNALQRGADGLYLFNYYLYPPLRNGLDFASVRGLLDEAAMRRGPLAFTVTKAYWQDHEDSYQYRKQLPVALKPGESRDVSLVVGLDSSELGDAGAAVLRLGWRGVEPSTRATVTLNGREVFAGPLQAAAATPPADSPHAKTAQRTPDLAQYVLDVQLPAHAARPGDNTVAVKIENSASVTLTDVELHLNFTPAGDAGSTRSTP